MSLTTPEVAHLLGVGPGAVRMLALREILHPLRRGARPLRFRDEEVAAVRQARWQAEQRAGGSRAGDIWAEVDRLLAAQVKGV